MPNTYLEIGAPAGVSLKMITCDAVFVGPTFAIDCDAIARRRNTHFFSGASDDFFSDETLPDRLFPQKIDLAFLDGIHLFEVLLRDFMNTERFATPQSVIVMHDCLPLNERMAGRDRAVGSFDEPERIRDFWTGDVWKVIPILIKYRPKLRISYLDCPPTGLVVCTNLDPDSMVLKANYDAILEEFRTITLASYGLSALWNLCPMYKSAQVVAAPGTFRRTLFN